MQKQATQKSTKAAIIKNSSKVYPRPFLNQIFEAGVEPIITTGYEYHPAEIAVHGVEYHGAIDFDAPRGTKILAPADGYYMATYGEYLLHNDNKPSTPRTLSYDQALKLNPSNTDIVPPAKTGDWPIYFGGYTVQGWHTRGRYTQNLHVDWVNPAIVYHPPSKEMDEQGKPTGNLEYSPILRAKVDDYRQPQNSTFIRQGTVIAEVGMTGCGWGKPCYDYAQFEVDGRPNFRGVDYPYYTSPHLHFVVFGQRAPYTRIPKRYDPFGIYGQVNAGYPKRVAQWNIKQPRAKHIPLWI